MARAKRQQKINGLVLMRVLCFSFVLSLEALTARAASPSYPLSYPLSYSGRLTLPGGEPMAGPVDMQLRFWDAASGGAALSDPFPFTGVVLNQGVFQVKVPTDSLDIESVFGDGTKIVFIEVIANGVTYPRQEFNFVPLALRVPVDKKTLGFNADGKLNVVVPSRTSPDSVLVIDNQGKFAWEPLAVSTLQTKPVSQQTPTLGQVLTYDGAQWIPKTMTQGGSGSASVAITAGSGLNGGTITTAGTISLAPTGVVAGTYARATVVVDSAGRITSASSGAPIDLASEVAGTLPVSKGGSGVTTLAANSLLLGNGVSPVQTLAPGASGNILTSNGTTWVSATAPQANSSTTGYLSSSDWTAFSQKQAAGNYLTALTGDLTTSGFSSGSATASLASISLPGTATKVTYDAKGRVTLGSTLDAADIPPLSAAKIDSGTLAVARGGTGTDLSATGGAGQYLKQTTTGGVVTVGAIPAGDITQSLGYTPLNKGGDTLAGALDAGAFNISNTGNVQLAASKMLGLGVYATDPTGLTAADKGKTWFNATTNQIKYWDGSSAVALGVSGSGLNSFNGQTGNTQTLGPPGTSGTAPAWSSASDTHTLNIPLASAVNVTAGLITHTEYAAFNGKVSSVAQGAGVAVATASGTATVSLATTGTAGSYAKVTTDSYGRVTAGDSLAPSDLPPHSAALITAGTLNVANGGTGVTSLAANHVILGNGTSAMQTVAPGSSGNVLTSDGTTWQSATLPATNWAAPGALGATTPNTGAFTSLSSDAQAGYEAKPYGTAAGNTGEVRLTELAAGGTNYVGFKAPDAIGANKIWVLPATDGSAGQVLKTDGAGNLGWVSGATGSVTSVGVTAPAAGITVSGGPITASGLSLIHI